MSYQTFQTHRSGVSHTAPYLVGGVPFLTGSSNMSTSGGNEIKIEFPFVSRKITVKNMSEDNVTLRVHFATSTGKVRADDTSPTNVNEHYHYVTLDSYEDAVEFGVRSKEIYISSQAADGAFELWAELTSIPTTEMFILSGSGITNDQTR
tara:strand:+ start:365 stop:814 length:450 start_codon:yes stop_codon:yes gene_type:complete